MDIRQLRYFIAVAESGSFSAASAKLRISQPSIGQQVRNLEEELGANLLLRHSRGIFLTSIGETFFDMAKSIVLQVDEAVRIIKDQSSEPFGEVRIGMTVSASVPLASPLIRATQRDVPRVKLSITEALSHYLIELVEQEHIDLALAFIGDFPAGIRGEHLAQEDFHLCMPCNHELAARETVRMRDVLEMPLLLPPESHMLRTQLDEVAAGLGTVVKVQAVVQSIGLMMDFVENEIGMTILPYAAVARQVAEGRLAAILIVEPTMTRTMTLLHSARRPMTNAEIAIRDIIRQLVKLKLESGTTKWRLPARRDS